MTLGAHEAQGRLFWTWLFTLPVLLLLGASAFFGAPWPTPLVANATLVVLAFPLIFVVGGPVLDTAREQLRRRRPGLDAAVAALAGAGWLAGLAALVSPAPDLSGPAAVLMALRLSFVYGRAGTR